MAKNNTMCDIPAEILERQMLIESIPHCMMVTLLFIATALVIAWYMGYKRENELSFRAKSFIITCITIVLFGLWYQASFLIVEVSTNILNPEYAGIMKFIQGCPQSIK